MGPKDRLQGEKRAYKLSSIAEKSLFLVKIGFHFLTTPFTKKALSKGIPSRGEG